MDEDANSIEIIVTINGTVYKETAVVEGQTRTGWYDALAGMSDRMAVILEKETRS